MWKKDFQPFGGADIYFSKRSRIKLKKLAEGEELNIISTVCPDYPHNGRQYTFSGQLGNRISLTAREHLRTVPDLVKILFFRGVPTNWLILLADLPEVTPAQAEFVQRLSGSPLSYLLRCAKSAAAIQREIGGSARVETFSTWYGSRQIDYLSLQTAAAKNILAAQDACFREFFACFCESRRPLAEKFRGRRLNKEELRQAGAHAISLYATHGTLLRKIFAGRKLLVINHNTINLRNFFLSGYVPLNNFNANLPKFIIGILSRSLY